MNSLTSSPVKSRPRYHRNAYHFVFSALQFTQEKLNRTAAHVLHEEEAHISGQELCDGLRELALQKFGLLTRTVLRHWGVNSTDDVGRIVFELIERGEMRKTDRDALDHFLDLYDFNEAFDHGYRVDVSKAFRDN
ncbi:MAG: Minf_1886 family protein [Planctomycetaceae bacterium]